MTQAFQVSKQTKKISNGGIRIEGVCCIEKIRCKIRGFNKMCTQAFQVSKQTKKISNGGIRIEVVCCIEKIRC